MIENVLCSTWPYQIVLDNNKEYLEYLQVFQLGDCYEYSDCSIL